MLRNVLIAAEAFNLKPSLNDIKFWLILIALAVAVIVLCCLFARNEKYKLKKEKEIKVEKKYEAPKIIEVKEKNK